MSSHNAEEQSAEDYLNSDVPVPNDAENLRRLLTELYVAVLGHMTVTPNLVRHQAAIDDVLTTVLDAAEGRPFKPIPLPWPPSRPAPGSC